MRESQSAKGEQVEERKLQMRERENARGEGKKEEESRMRAGIHSKGLEMHNISLPHWI